MAKNCRFAVAVHVCAVLALNDDSQATSDWLAKSVNTNPVVVRRILSALSKAGLVKSQRGIAGGTMLAKSSDSITLLDISLAVEEDRDPALPSQEPNPKCAVGAFIRPVMTQVMAQIETARNRELASITLAEIVGRLLQCGADA